MSQWFDVRKIGVATVAGFDSGSYLDSKLLEVIARHPVPCRALFIRLLGLILAGLRW